MSSSSRPPRTGRAGARALLAGALLAALTPVLPAQAAAPAAAAPLATIRAETGAEAGSGAETGTGADTGADRWSETAHGFASLAGGTTGGAGGEVVTVTDAVALARYAAAPEPYVIQVSGALTLQPFGTEITVASDKTILGLGDIAELVHGGLHLNPGTHNVVIRNLTIRDTAVEGDWDCKNTDYDGIQMDSVHHVWIDHNRFSRICDGQLDIRKDSEYVTVSYNRFEDNNKTFGIGWTPNVRTQITVDHNLFARTKQRNPSADNAAYAHLYNNLLTAQNDPADPVWTYGNWSRGRTRMVIENSYYEDVQHPFQADETAELVQRGSILRNTSGRHDTRGDAFDPRAFYDYRLDPASAVPALVHRFAGPQKKTGKPLARTGAPSASALAAAADWTDDTADGFASVDALGQNGTHGGRDGRTVLATTLADLEKYATAAEPYTVVVQGTITMVPKGREIKVASDKTIVGAGTTGHLVGGGFFLGTGVHNVIIRNLTIRDSSEGIWNDDEHDFDAIQMDGAHHVWIDHNTLRDQADGLIDSRKDTTYVTISWNRLSDNNKTLGIGWTPNTTAALTLHHNWLYETQQRNPSADNAARAHLYNNYLQDDPAGPVSVAYGNYARGATRMVLENSYFKGVRNPVTKDPTAALVQRGNVFDGTSGRNESGPDSTGAGAFDPRSSYDYRLDPATEVPALVTAGAGPRAAIGVLAPTVITVARDGSSDYTTVQAAVDAVPAGNALPVTVAVAPGDYRETVRIPRTKRFVTVQGTGPSRRDTRIAYDNAAGTPKPDGTGTYGTSGSATFAVEADDTRLRNLSVVNSFDEAAHQDLSGHQAVALRTAADRIDLTGLIVEGDQDTLQTDSASRDVVGRVRLTDSYVAGNVDFLFGRGTVVVDGSVLTLRKRWDGSSAGYVTAPSTAAGRKGILITRSVIDGDVAPGSFHLGRPWHAGGDASLDPQTVVRDSRLGAAVRPAPWTDMGGFSWRDDRFAEYRDLGPGSGPASADRPQLTDAQAADHEPADWLGDWTPAG
ncbi:pectinesterase family protein [Streptomyces filamentosus]|uniref:pectinesterase family protein n=1 Tax=Streptomyces filamentosus TaxID=67294 RepID=UPI00332EE393